MYFHASALCELHLFGRVRVVRWLVGELIWSFSNKYSWLNEEKWSYCTCFVVICKTRKYNYNTSIQQRYIYIYIYIVNKTTFSFMFYILISLQNFKEICNMFATSLANNGVPVVLMTCLRGNRTSAESEAVDGTAERKPWLKGFISRNI